MSYFENNDPIKEASMRVINILLYLFIGLSANELSIDEQITILRDAPPQERYQLMNALKARISTMNSTQRTEAIQKLRQQHNTPSTLTLPGASAAEGFRHQMQQQGRTLQENVKGVIDQTHTQLFLGGE
jgi:hypothetical protein